MATTRIYRIAATTPGAKPRLVRASHPDTALRHVAQTTYTVTVATQDELVECVAGGIQVEQVRHEQQPLA